MGKKVWALCSLFLLFSGIASASPLTDYSLGKTAIDVGFGSSDVKGDQEPRSYDRKGSNSIGITTGLGGKFAIQFKETGIRSADFQTYNAYGAETTHVAPTIRTNEVNVLYKVNNNCSAFIGNLTEIVDFKADVMRLTDSENTIQAGLIATKELGSKVTGYGLIGLGKDIQNYQVGVGYHISKQVDFNLEYHRVTYRNTNLVNARYSMACNGFNAGFTYTF